jgi:hypothetical protein
MATITQQARRAVTIATIATALTGWGLTSTGCSHPPPPYGVEHGTRLPGLRRQVWAVAPVLNLSGEKAVDPILQADLLYQQLQQVEGLTVIPVNRTAEAMAALHWDKIQSEQQAAIVCEMLGCDGLVLATVTAYDPYNPPKLGASLQLFRRPAATANTAAARTGGATLNPRQMARQAAPVYAGPAPATTVPAANSGMVQVVGMYDAQNGSVRSAVLRYAQGRNDPQGPYATKEYFVSMDRFGGFVYHVLIADLLNSPRLWRSPQ